MGTPDEHLTFSDGQAQPKPGSKLLVQSKSKNPLVKPLAKSPTTPRPQKVIDGLRSGGIPKSNTPPPAPVKPVVSKPKKEPKRGNEELANLFKPKEAVSTKKPDRKLMVKDPAPKALPLPPLPAIDQITPSITPRKPRPKQKRARSLYTLGPGDSVNFATFERADLSRTVTIAPDGSVSYLQAIAVNAKGLTVDQLRDRMENELQKFRRDFKLIVTPASLQSKEYAILGRVRKPGTFVLDRPTTVLEGIARAKGVEIGTIRGAAYGLADFERSFVARKGRKLDVDFSKLYHEGDLSQNVYLQPDDYLYVASVLKNQFYILGAVNRPGRIKMPDKITVAKAISMAGGFSNDAYRMKVLVVRGDINAPEVHVVNVRDVLRGKALDIPVENKDIIFVAKRPFEMVERAVDIALTTYVQTVTAEAMNQNYTPFTLD